MKYFALLIALATTTIPLFAGDSRFISELEQLQKQREKDIAAAIEPINRHYLAALEQLRGSATQAKDLDAALKIQQAAALIPKPISQPMEADIVGVWVVAVGKWEREMEFKADGTLTTSWDNLTGTWERTDKELKFTLIKDKRVLETDVFHLPIRKRQLFGSDNTGKEKTLTKKSK